MKVRCTLRIVEINGKSTPAFNPPELTVDSHQVRSSLVVIHAGNKKLTVKASELRAAIANATRVPRHA